jgi:hypothetical protein
VSQSREVREDVEFRRRAAEELERHRVNRVRAFARDGVSVREAAEALQVNKETVVKYRRLAGLTPPAPLKHLGGGRWVSANEDDEDDDEQPRAFRR